MTSEEELQQTVADFKETFSSERGTRVLAKLARYCLSESPIFVPDNVNQTMYNLGAHATYRYIMHFVNFDWDKHKPIRVIS